jgi:phosphatidylethanolamine/phosphatidyl-N-methylethanolamine N-methyltransferase
MSDFRLFFGKFLRHGTAIASVAPSSRWLSRLCVRNVDWQRSSSVVELGGGTGPITRVIAERASPSCRVVVVERDLDFARLLRERFGQFANFEIVTGDVGNLSAILAERGIATVDHIISGLPVPSLAKSVQAELFRAVDSVLKPEGTFNQITEIPWVYWGFYRRFFDDVQFVFEPRNIPPGGVYFCRRPRRGSLDPRKDNAGAGDRQSRVSA